MDLTLLRLLASCVVAFILSPSLCIDSYNSNSNTAHGLASTICNLCLSNLNHIISYTRCMLHSNIYDREKQGTEELLDFVLGFGVMARQHMLILHVLLGNFKRNYYEYLILKKNLRSNR
jgi:hypothetical protein